LNKSWYSQCQWVIAPNVNWPKSRFFVHVDEQGTLSPALIEQFLPARAALLKDFPDMGYPTP
jgi:hypothetical protein